MAGKDRYRKVRRRKRWHSENVWVWPDHQPQGIWVQYNLTRTKSRRVNGGYKWKST